MSVVAFTAAVSHALADSLTHDDIKHLGSFHPFDTEGLTGGKRAILRSVLAQFASKPGHRTLHKFIKDAVELAMTKSIPQQRKEQLQAAVRLAYVEAGFASDDDARELGNAATIERVNPAPTQVDSVPEAHIADATKESRMNAQPKLFISHASADSSLARALVDMIEASFEVPDGVIRCTSVPGYQLLGGEKPTLRLRTDIESSRILIGIVTDASLRSSWVLFELGAAWGMQRRVVPIVKGIKFDSLPDVIRESVALRFEARGDISRLVEDLRGACAWRQKSQTKTDDAITRIVQMAEG